MRGFRPILATVAVIAIAGILMVVPTARAQALDGSGFDPGYIISDENFYSPNAMSEAEIQSFLDGMIGTCSNGQCLNVLRSDLAGRGRLVSDSTGLVRCEALPGGSALRASTIIHRAQVACGVSAKVILVTLQKEQGLVNKKAPSKAALDRAMGYGCPDTAPCAADSLGFANQIYKGALQLNTYRAARFGRQPGVQAIRFSPRAECGSSVVNVRNFATAALYNYTPYQPNAAALRNLGGTGDTCSAYGNRNFWVFYNNWFGSTGTAQGYVEIERAYRLAGGAAGPLGAAVTEPTTNPGNGGGLVQGFQSGAIAWSAGRGAFVISGTIRARFAESGGLAGLGWPTGPANATSAGGGGLIQGFQNGAITSNSTSGTHVVNGAIRIHYGLVGGVSGPLAWPTQSEQCAAQGLCTQDFQGGRIVWRGERGAQSVLRPILTPFDALGGLAGQLGWPVSATNASSVDGGGNVQAFDGGALAVSAVGGAHKIAGGVRSVFAAAGGLTGAPGWPTADESCAANACTQTFRGGTIFSGSDGRGGLVTPATQLLYSAAGGATGPLGLPISNESVVTTNGGGRVQAFVGGALAMPAKGGGYVVSGDIRGYFNGEGGLNGRLGWPRSNATCTSVGVCTQVFDGGTIVFDPRSGGSVRPNG